MLITYSRPQAEAVKRLLAKGWREPWSYRGSVLLFLPLPARRRRANQKLGLWRDYTRPPIRVTVTGRIIAGYPGQYPKPRRKAGGES